MKKGLVVMLVVLMGSGMATAKEHRMMKELSPEERVKMAQRHEKMAQCLKSEKSMKECRREMHDDSEMSCPGMGKE